jgi:hypothetical protein
VRVQDLRLRRKRRTDRDVGATSRVDALEVNVSRGDGEPRNRADAHVRERA